MATWDNTTLSTLQSITKFENEINNLAGSYIANGLAVAEGGVITFSANNFTAANMIYSDGTVFALTRSSTTAVFSAAHATTTAYLVITIQATHTDGTIYSFPVLSSSGTIYDTSLTYYITLTSGIAYSTYDAVGSWQKKITLAKEILGLRIKRSLFDKGIYDSYYDTDTTNGNVLDYLTNANNLCLTSDLLVLNCIFEDLHNSYGYEIYKSKREYYAQRYEIAYGEAIPLVLYNYNSNTGSIVFTEKRLSI